MSTEKSAPFVSTRAPTSIDVARRAGVSQASVSRYLNGRPLSPDMVEAIKAAIAELGYRPNQSARSLVTARSNVIAVVIGDMLNGYYAELISTINQELSKSGLKSLIVEGRTGLGSSPGEILSEVDVDGVIVATSLMLAQQEELILASGKPIVFFNRPSIRSCDTVHTQNELGGELAGELLVRLGHRRIAVISGPEGADAIVARHLGFTEALRKAGATDALKAVVTPGFDYDRGYAAAIELLKNRADRPTALFCHNDQLALAALNAARALSIAVPGELSVVGFDDVSMASWETLSLTTMRQPIREMATTAVDLVVKRIREPERAVETVILPCTLVERGSTGPAADVSKRRTTHATAEIPRTAG